MKKLKVFFSVLMVLSATLAYSQNIQVKGKVTDATTGEPLPGAAILIKGTPDGVVADANGNYTVSVSAKGTLGFTTIGYKDLEVAVNGRAVINVGLESDNELLEETIVVAYGTTTKAAFTGSASVVKSEDLEKRQVSNLTNALTGTVSGVQVIQSNGQPGSSATIRVRGFGSMAASNSPLYVVDGVPFEGDITSINSQDIESMTVLKDAAAAALYGARGANGVIIVTTKKGRAGEAEIIADIRVGVNSRAVKNYDVLTDPATYMETAYAALANAGTAPSYAKLIKAIGTEIYTVPEGENLIGEDGKINPNATLGYSDGDFYYTPDDWAKETIQSQIRQEYNVSVRGGSEKLKYYASVGYLNDKGIIVNSDFNRVSTRFSADYKAKKWLTIGTNIGYSSVDSNNPSEQTNSGSSVNAFYVANMIAPVYPMYVRLADKTILKDEFTGKSVYDYGDGSITPYVRNFMSMSNPVSDLFYNTEKRLSDLFNINAYAKIDFFDGFSYKATVSADLDNTRFRNVNNKLYGQSSEYGGYISQEMSRQNLFTQQHILTYAKQFGPHTVDVLAGFEASKLESEGFWGVAYNLYSPDNWTLSNAIDQKDCSGSYVSTSRTGFIGRASYDFADKYYFSASFRRDGSSVFAPENRWGNFWSASAAWNLASEDFIKDYDWIDLLKVKASFGQQGNDNLGRACVYLDQYKVSGSEGVFSDGQLDYKGNRELTWEKSNALNAGVDFGLFAGKLSGTVEYYNRITSDMLYNKPVAPANGYTSFPMNIGSLSNSGVEVELLYTPIQTADFKWDIFANATTNTSKVLKLHPDLEGKMISGSRIYREGAPVYNLYMVKYAGVDEETGEALYWAKDENDEEFKTADWSDAQSTNRCETGDIIAKVYGGFGTSVEFKGFDFSINCSYQLGGRIYDYSYADLMHSGGSYDLGQNWHKDILNAWTPENTKTDVPRVCNIDDYANARSTRFLISSNYLSINNITFGYTFGQKILKNAPVKSVRVYVSGDNLAVFSARQGLDPRISFSEAEGTASYSPIRTVSGGVKFTF